MGTKAIKLGTWDKHPVILLGLECHVWRMRNEINVMEHVFFKFYSYNSRATVPWVPEAFHRQQSSSSHARKKPLVPSVGPPLAIYILNRGRLQQ